MQNTGTSSLIVSRQRRIHNSDRLSVGWRVSQRYLQRWRTQKAL